MHLTSNVGKESSTKQENIVMEEIKNLKFQQHYAIEAAIDTSSWFCTHCRGMRTHLHHFKRRLCINLP